MYFKYEIKFDTAEKIAYLFRYLIEKLLIFSGGNHQLDTQVLSYQLGLYFPCVVCLECTDSIHFRVSVFIA